MYIAVQVRSRRTCGPPPVPLWRVLAEDSDAWQEQTQNRGNDQWKTVPLSFVPPCDVPEGSGTAFRRRYLPKQSLHLTVSRLPLSQRLPLLNTIISKQRGGWHGKEDAGASSERTGCHYFASGRAEPYTHSEVGCHIDTLKLVNLPRPW